MMSISKGYPVPEGMDPKDWNSKWGITYKEWHQIMAKEAQAYWDRLPQSERDRWDAMYAETFKE